MRKLTTFEKAQVYNLPFFHDLCEIEALEAAQDYISYVAKEGDDLETLAKLKEYSRQLLIAGHVGDRTGLAKTWLTLNDLEIEVVEKPEYGLQLVETLKVVAEQKDPQTKSQFREVMDRTFIVKSSTIENAPPVVVEGVEVKEPSLWSKIFG